MVPSCALLRARRLRARAALARRAPAELRVKRAVAIGVGPRRFRGCRVLCRAGIIRRLLRSRPATGPLRAAWSRRCPTDLGVHAARSNAGSRGKISRVGWAALALCPKHSGCLLHPVTDFKRSETRRSSVHQATGTNAMEWRNTVVWRPTRPLGQEGAAHATSCVEDNVNTISEAQRFKQA